MVVPDPEHSMGGDARKESSDKAFQTDNKSNFAGLSFVNLWAKAFRWMVMGRLVTTGTK